MAKKRDFWVARIEKTKELIEQWEDAVLALTTGQIQSYTLNTSQTQQTVTRYNLAALQAAIDGMYNRLATLEARVYGCGRTNVRPDW